MGISIVGIPTNDDGYIMGKIPIPLMLKTPPFCGLKYV